MLTLLMVDAGKEEVANTRDSEFTETSPLKEGSTA